jgi:flavodoxin
MKILLGAGFIFLLIMSAYAPLEPEQNILIVHLSRTSNTKAVAEMIHKKVGGDMVELELENPYPKDYQKIVDQVAKENETGFLPPLSTKIKHIEQYGKVFIGFPTWGMQLPPPVKSFLHEYDLIGKTIIPFNTHAGYGVGSGFEQVKQLCLQSTVLEGLSIEGGYEREGIFLAIKDKRAKEVQKLVDEWLSRFNIKTLH